MIYIIVAVIVVILILVVRFTIRGAVVDRLPVDPDERVLLDESDLRVLHRIRDTTGGKTMIGGARVLLTDGRILVATGGPEGKHKFFIRCIVEYGPAASSKLASATGGYHQRFHLEQGFATYPVMKQDIHVAHDEVRIRVPFPDAGPFFVPPEVTIYSRRPEVYRAIFG
jgi:hypothetical protein